jgi:ABC-type iron transport system FetAB ATPase subunit
MVQFTFFLFFSQVGCGKSSLLSALLGDMKRTRGVANVHGRVAYVAQQAWIQNNTLSDNITFGKRFNAELYHKVPVPIIFKTIYILKQILVLQSKVHLRINCTINFTG